MEDRAKSSSAPLGSSARRPKSLEAEVAGDALKAALSKHRGDLTIADAAAAAGLPLRDAEAGLFWLSKEYQGTLSTTEKGELLFRFPHGFSVPLTKRSGFRRFVDKAKRVVLGVGKFVVRAWITVVLVGYVGVFLAVLLAMMFGGKGEDRGGNLGGLIYVLVRVLSEALFWTFHPFSPFAHSRAYEGRNAWGRQQKKRDEVPFYERVNRFVFGPEKTAVDPAVVEQALLSQIRAQRGRVGIGDVLRVTGLPREEADPLMARLMLDYDGDVKVSDDGGIFYEFPALRRTTDQSGVERGPPAVWTKTETPRPVTGNPNKSNVLIAALNGFNLLMSLVALKANWTIERLMWIFEQSRSEIPLPPLPYDGPALVLGLIPFVFSMALFALPVYRWATSASEKKRADEENAKRAVLKTVLEDLQQQSADKPGVTEGRLKAAWQRATGSEPESQELTNAVVALGGDVDMDANTRTPLFRFRDLEAEVKALQKEREQASEEEKRVGEVIFEAR